MDTQESPIEAEATDRKELLAQQFAEAETAPEPVEDRPRASDGKFAPKTPVETQAAPEPAQEVEEPVWKRPPSSWKRDYHEAWQGADDKLKEYAYQREEEMRKGIEPLLPKAQFADRIQKVMQPYEQTIRGLGIEPEAAVEALMRADHTLRTAPLEQKKAYLAQLASQYGINLGEVDPSLQPAQIDPTVYQLQQELTNVRGQVVSWQQQQEANQQAQLNAEIEAFSRTADHFEEVRPIMIQLLNSGVVTDLKGAYEKAIRLDDNLFSEIQKAQQGQDDATKRAAADKAAKIAKAAAVSVRSSTPGASAPTKAQDRRSLLSEQLDGLSERF